LGELKKENTDLYEQLKENHQPEESVLTIKSGNRYEVVSLAEISHIEADDYHAIIHRGEREKKLMRISLKTLEAQLPNYFLRVHRKYIVNRLQVESFATESPHLLLRNGTRISVAKSRQKEVRALFAGERVR
ncbi:MAG: LytTR family DNA-binding domain-containing protein, partial [Bacteroidota bacterium]